MTERVTDTKYRPVYENGERVMQIPVPKHKQRQTVIHDLSKKQKTPQAK